MSNILSELYKDAKSSDFYKWFTKNKYHKLTGYCDYHKAVDILGKCLYCYHHYIETVFLKNTPPSQQHIHSNPCGVLHYAYQNNFKPLWLDKKLTEAFLNTNLPNKIFEFKKVIDVGLLFLPSVIKNPDGYYCQWVIFFHKSKNIKEIWLDTEITTETTKLRKICFDSPTDDSIVWFTVLDNDTQYSSNFKLKKINNEVQIKSYADMDIIYNEKYSEKFTGTKDQEKNFCDTIQKLILQTLLYLQTKPEEQKQLTDNTIFSKPTFNKQIKVSSNNKLTPVVIGRNYQTKRATTSYNTGSGSKKATHWRIGHYRFQFTGNKENPDHKWIWIEPVLVNG